jgi:protein-S-isoprenylcysteine O-methyltransferase Ste14
MTLRIRAALHSIPYLLLCLVILPWVFARSLGSGPITGRGVMLGGLLMVAGFGLSAWCVRLLVVRGGGTQSPLDPTKHLVVAGPYRHVRNPMIVGNLLLLCGEAVLFSSRGVLLYAVLFWLTWHVLLVSREEPSLRRRFGSEYDTYRRKVPRWLPRVAGAAATQRKTHGPPRPGFGG